MFKKTLFFLLFIPIFAYCGKSGLEFTTKIREILQNVPAGTNFAVLIINPLTNDTLYAHNVNSLMAPASVTKLFTTLTAMNTMGPNYKISTKFFSSDKNISDGTINGDLYIKGYGNSVFSSSDLREMVQELRKKGVTAVTGDIVGDGSYFDDEYFRNDWIDEEPGAAGIPPVSALVLDRNHTLIRKKLRRKKYGYVSQNVQNPPQHIAGVLRSELQEAGIRVGGIARTGVTPSNATEVAENHIILSELIKTINKRSDNFLAECLFKLTGAVSSKEEGNAFYASQAVNQFLEEHDISTDGTKIVDGSGLSHFNQTSVRCIAGLLEWAYLDFKAFGDFLRSLSVAGDDGTLRGRMLDSPAANNFFGKTGTLNGFSSLAGYLRCPDGDDLIVAMIFQFQKKGAHYYKGMQDRIIELLAGYKSKSGQ
jgi:serine-type D-Ala-D-Ala carboxypeptidase/endopeptidase (penicillin-binding protein 4)